MKLTFSHNKKIFLLLFIVVVLSGCEQIKAGYEQVKGVVDNIRGGSNAKEAPVMEVPVFAVNTTLAARGQIQDYISLSGDIISGTAVDVYSDAAGKVSQIFTATGSRIKKGDRIASIDPSRPGLTYRNSIVTAPIDGTVIALPAQVGMTISQAVPVARISGSGGLEIKLSVAERFISKMAMNLPCLITLDAWPGDFFQGSISEISPTVDLASRTMEVRVNVSNVSSKLKPGMFAKVRIITESKDNIVKIPGAAVIRRFGEEYVFVVEKDPSDSAFNIVKKRNIVPGILIDGILEIQSGLAPDEEIVVRGQTLLDDGSRVNIIDRTSALGAN
ncbi:MAG: efflux RND transporter periplasmic adaptor subunit [Treponema sp.]|jgi:multidrug efflux pump subunit AcrA (membrane-fusion protein)|nr:efflux RND transporter periplasmic adaptor subunit [Treponema sp.]